MNRSLGLALLGCGNVGLGLLRLLRQRQANGFYGVDLELRHILVRDLFRDRPAYVPRALVTNDPDTILADPHVDIVVEVIGGMDAAYQHVRRALEAGKHVVTANKELMAFFGDELISLASERGVALHYEASVGGGIPIVRMLHQDLAANEISSVEAIINGTTNYILTRMAAEGWSLEKALAQAQALGYAEPDPSNDVSGYDAACKLCILARLAFGLRVTPGEVYREGIQGLEPEDFRQASRLGYAIKLVSLARWKDGGVVAGVHPSLLAREHPLSRVADVFNGVRIEADLVGSLFISGRGAGPEPTASALMADILAISRYVAVEGVVPWPYRRADGLRLLPFAEAEYRYFMRLRTSEAPDLVGRVTAAFSRFGIQVASVLREPSGYGQHITVLTGRAQESRYLAVLGALRRMEGISVESSLRVLE